MNGRTILKSVAASAACALLAGCFGGKQTSREAWQQVLQPCMDSQTMGSKENQIYFGPSNNVGAGALWRKKADGSYALVFPTDKVPSFDASVIRKNTPAECAGGRTTTLDAKVGASFVTSALKGLSGAAGFEASKADSVKVELAKVSVERIEEGPFLMWYDRHKNEDGYPRALTRPEHYVVSEAYRVHGPFKATLTFKRGGAATAEANFKAAAANASLASLGAKLDVKATSDTDLVVSTADDFYVLGVIGKFDPNVGIGGPQPLITAAPRPKKSEIGTDLLSVEPAE